jgi:nucleoside-diphosphate-sugar epimerase
MVDSSRVLVTGGSGFVGTHCVAALLLQGHTVRATVRSLSREAEVRSAVERAGTQTGAGAHVDPGDRLGIVEADLRDDAGWDPATAGCSHVLHVASPFPTTPPRHADDLVVPAREGTLRVLRAARDAGVGRVVLTSSFAAVGYGRPLRDRPYTEDDWSDPDGRISAYARSKTLAERAAWDFVGREGRGLELSVVNPVAVFGPVPGRDLSSSVELVRRLLTGDVPGLPRLTYGIVDVRDVADLHVRAMTHPDAAGERFLAVSGTFLSVPEMAEVLRHGLGPAAARVPTRVLPDWLVRVASLVTPELRGQLTELGRRRSASSAKARRVLGWDPRPPDEALLATGASLRDLGLLD